MERNQRPKIRPEILDKIARTTEKQNEELRERIRRLLINVGTHRDKSYLVSWARNLNRRGIERCLHLGFSEKTLLQALSGIFKLEVVPLKNSDKDKRVFRLMAEDKEELKRLIQESGSVTVE